MPIQKKAGILRFSKNLTSAANRMYGLCENGDLFLPLRMEYAQKEEYLSDDMIHPSFADHTFLFLRRFPKCKKRAPFGTRLFCFLERANRNLCE